MMSAEYPLSDGSVPARMNGPSARAVSNAVNASPGNLPNANGASDYLWQWGQFLDHDIDETPVGAETFDIEVPAGDPWFDPMNTGTQVIGMHRSEYMIDGSGKRQHLNNITAYIDASNVYGSEDALAHWLRTNDGTGMLKTSAGDLAPLQHRWVPQRAHQRGPDPLPRGRCAMQRTGGAHRDAHPVRA